MVHVLNLRLCQGCYPKWVRRYADMATMVKRINTVTYLVHSDRWYVRNKVVHGDKLKLANRPGEGGVAPS